MANYSVIAEEIFRVLHSRAFRITMYDNEGNHVYEPSDARKFYIEEPGLMISLNEDPETSSLRFYINQDVKYAELLVLIRQLRILASKFGILFNFQKSNKQITPKLFATNAIIENQEEKYMLKLQIDYKCQIKPTMIVEAEDSLSGLKIANRRRLNSGYGEAQAIRVRLSDVSDIDVSLYESMYGTSRSSYLNLENARMIVRHSRPVRENIIGARGRNVAQVFIENAQKERFLMPTGDLHAGRAMTQHINQGGNFADVVGAQITSMANDFANLNSVLSKLPKSHNEFGRIAEACVKTRNNFRKMGRGNRAYESVIANLPTYPLLEGNERESLITEISESLKIELPENVMESLMKIWNLKENDSDNHSYSEPVIVIANREWPRRLISALQNKQVKFNGPVKWNLRTRFYNLDDQLSTKLADLSPSLADVEMGNLASWISDTLENAERLKPVALKNLRALAAMFISAAGGTLSESEDISLETSNPKLKEFQDWILAEDAINSDNDEMEEFEQWLMDDVNIDEEANDDLMLSDEDFIDEAPTDWLNHNGKPRDNNKKPEKEKPFLLTKKAAISEDDFDSDTLEAELDSAWNAIGENNEISEDIYSDEQEDLYVQDEDTFFENFPFDEFYDYINQDLAHGSFYTNGSDLIDEEKTLYKSEIISALEHFIESKLFDIGIPGTDGSNYPNQIKTIYNEIYSTILSKGFDVIDDLNEETDIPGTEFEDHQGLDLLYDAQSDFDLDEQAILKRAGLI